MFGFAGNDIHAVGENGTFLHYDGKAWNKAGTTTGALMAKVWGRAPNDVYAVGVLAEAARGILMHYDGTGWIEEREFDDGLTAVWGTKDFVLIAGLNGKIYKKTATKDWYLLVTLEKNPFATPEPSVHPDDAFAPVVDALWGNDATHFGAACDLDTTVFYRDPSMWVPEYDPVNRKPLSIDLGTAGLQLQLLHRRQLQRRVARAERHHVLALAPRGARHTRSRESGDLGHLGNRHRQRAVRRRPGSHHELARYE